MRIAMALGALVLALGCGGLMGFGNEMGRGQASSGTPFSFSFTTNTDQPHQLWLDYELTSTGPFEVTGPLEAKVNGQSVGTWTLDLRPDQAPIVGETTQMSMNSMNSSVNGNYTASATVWLTEVPAQPQGTTVEISGTWTAGASTTVTRLEPIATD